MKVEKLLEEAEINELVTSLDLSEGWKQKQGIPKDVNIQTISGNKQDQLGPK